MNAETWSRHVSATAVMQTGEPGRSTDRNILALFYGKKKFTSLGCYFSGPPFPIYHPLTLSVQCGTTSVFPVSPVLLVISGGCSHSIQLFLKVSAQPCIFLMYQKGHMVIWFCGSHFPSLVDVQECAQMVSGARYVAKRSDEMTSISPKKRKHPAK
jgi:hypothetical protein